MIVNFDHGVGLKSRDGGKLQRFGIKSEDGDLRRRKCSSGLKRLRSLLKSAMLGLSNPEGANLINGEGLPASGFASEAAK